MTVQDSGEPTSTAGATSDPTEQLWLRRSPRSAAVPSAAALTGVDTRLLRQATAIAVASSPEAAALLEGMEYRIRTLPTTVETSAERCVNSVRGPVMWAETITARANALGNDDVFVCMTTRRSYDRIENQLLLDALSSIAAAGRALDGHLGERVETDDAERIRAVAHRAETWCSDSRFAGIRPGRLTGRAAARVRGGHRRAAMAPVLAVRRRTLEPFAPADLVGLADEWTRRLHRTASRVLDALERPRTLTLSDGGLWCRSLSFRHPAATGGGPAGLAFRGVPVLPPPEDVAGAPWESSMPTDGVRVPADADAETIRDVLRQSVSSSA